MDSGLPSEGYAAVFSVPVLPQNLKGAQSIAQIFGVSRDTVTRWAKQGAPIRRIGNKLQADYHLLWAWLLHAA